MLKTELLSGLLIILPQPLDWNLAPGPPSGWPPLELFSPRAAVSDLSTSPSMLIFSVYQKSVDGHKDPHGHHDASKENTPHLPGRVG
ncbi:MAG: hypothetical protein LBI84_00405 [Propionibacteriaceae bacterium]|nr:hypothetical protein [Propionibacteriaceae bacterium]